MCFLFMRTSCLVEIVRHTHTCIAVLGPATFTATYIICSHSYQLSMMQRRCQVYAGYVLCRALVIIVIININESYDAYCNLAM